VEEETGATTSHERNVRGTNRGFEQSQIAPKITTNGKR
jgi:hypothetical protein